MEGRKKLKLSSLHQRKKSDLDDNWFTVGVIVVKSEPKMSSKVRLKNYSFALLYFGVNGSLNTIFAR